MKGHLITHIAVTKNVIRKQLLSLHATLFIQVVEESFQSKEYFFVGFTIDDTKDRSASLYYTCFKYVYLYLPLFFHIVPVSNKFLESSQRYGYCNLKMCIEDFSRNNLCCIQGQDCFLTFQRRTDNIHGHKGSVQNKPKIKTIILLDIICMPLKIFHKMVNEQIFKSQSM